METRKLKLLFKDRKGILLKSIPSSLSDLYTLIEKYYKSDPLTLSLFYSDSEKDLCEIVDEMTFEACLSEFLSTITIKIAPKLEKSSLHSPASQISLDHQSLKFFKPRTRNMAIFDIELETLSWIHFPLSISFKEYAAWVELPNGEIFYCGGGNPVPSNEVYLLNPYLKTVKPLANMLEARHSHGISYCNGSVYVMGGIKMNSNQTKMIKDCEKYDLSNERWEKIYDMDVERGDTSVFAMNDSILVFGKGSNFLVKYNSDDFKLDLQSDEGGCMSFAGGNLYIFSSDKVKVCNLNNRQIIEECRLPKKKSWWSHCPPVVFNQFIYFVWWEEPGYICRFNRETKEFKCIFSL
jgi:hypothetical protein